MKILFIFIFIKLYSQSLIQFNSKVDISQTSVTKQNESSSITKNFIFLGSEIFFNDLIKLNLRLNLSGNHIFKESLNDFEYDTRGINNKFYPIGDLKQQFSQFYSFKNNY